MIHLLARNSGALVRVAVLREIDGDPAIRESEVAVAAEDGLVTLAGCVGSRNVKVAVVRAAKRVPGVRIVANDLHVKGGNERSDTDIARDALHCLRNNRASRSPCRRSSATGSSRSTAPSTPSTSVSRPSVR